VVWTGLKVSALPADDDHPYGHGKAEPLAGWSWALVLLAAAVFIAVESVREILTPHHTPAWFTLVVAGPGHCDEGNGLPICVESERRTDPALRSRRRLASPIRCDHLGRRRSSEFPSRCWAARAMKAPMTGGVAGLRRHFLQRLSHLPDGAQRDHGQRRARVLQKEIREIAAAVSGVVRTEKCHTRKSGLDVG